MILVAALVSSIPLESPKATCAAETEAAPVFSMTTEISSQNLTCLCPTLAQQCCPGPVAKQGPHQVLVADRGGQAPK